MSIAISSINRLFKKTYDPYRYHCQRYPKAAKKARIRKKWRNRFGPDLLEQLLAPNPLYDFLNSQMGEPNDRYHQQLHQRLRTSEGSEYQHQPEVGRCGRSVDPITY